MSASGAADSLGSWIHARSVVPDERVAARRSSGAALRSALP
jgi:hypothetical protein